MDIKTYIFFLVLTSAIWFLMQLSDEYNKNFDIPLSFSDINKEFILTNKSDNKITVTVSAKGFKIIALSDINKKKLTVSLKNLKLKKRNDGFYYASLATSGLVKAIYSQLDLKTSRSKIEPDSLHFVFDKKAEAQVPVIFNAVMDIVPGYRIYGKANVQPEKIKVTGPKHIIDTLSFISTEKINLKNLNTSFKKKLSLIKPDKLLSLNTNSVVVSVKIVEFIQAETEVPVKVKTNIPDFKVKIFPPLLKVKYQIAMPDYKKISDSLFSVEVFIDSLDALRKKSLIPVIKRYPPFVENPKLSIDKVDFIILKK